MKKSIISFCVLIASAIGAMADDSFSVDNVALSQNGEADVVVRFSLDEGSTCSGYTFWLKVPEELAFSTYDRSGRTYVVYTVGDCYDDPPTITPNLDEGYLKVGCLTANSDPLNKQDGILVTFRIKASAHVNVGDIFTGTLTNGTVSAENGTVHNVANASFTVTIGNPIDTRTILDETSTTPPEPATGVDVRVKRSIKGGEWNTICLPFAMTEEQVNTAFGNDVEFGDFTGYDAETDESNNVTALKLNFDLITAIEANHPYIIKVPEDVMEFTVDGVDINPEEDPCVEQDNGRTGRNRQVYSGFYGTYTADLNLANFLAEGDYPLFLSGNKFWYATEDTQPMKAFRAYFWLSEVLTDVENASSCITMSFNDNNTTGISATLNDKGEMINEKCYDLQGRRVESSIFNSQSSILRKGLYIREGKVVVVK